MSIAEKIQVGLNGIYKVEYITGVRALKIKINGIKYTIKHSKTVHLPKNILDIECERSHFDMRLLYALLYIFDDVGFLYFRTVNRPNGNILCNIHNETDCSFELMPQSFQLDFFSNNIQYLIDDFHGKQIIDYSYNTQYPIINSLSETQLRLFRAHKAYRRHPILFDYDNDSWNARKYPIIYQYL